MRFKYTTQKQLKEIYNQGYTVGIKNGNIKECNYTDEALRDIWINGYLRGKKDRTSDNY